jgi:hypothetical protein
VRVVPDNEGRTEGDERGDDDQHAQRDGSA